MPAGIYSFVNDTHVASARARFIPGAAERRGASARSASSFSRPGGFGGGHRTPRSTPAARRRARRSRSTPPGSIAHERHGGVVPEHPTGALDDDGGPVPSAHAVLDNDHLSGAKALDVRSLIRRSAGSIRASALMPTSSPGGYTSMAHARATRISSRRPAKGPRRLLV